MRSRKQTYVCNSIQYIVGVEQAVVCVPWFSIDVYKCIGKHSKSHVFTCYTLMTLIKCVVVNGAPSTKWLRSIDSLNSIHKQKVRVPECRKDTARTRSQAVNKHESRLLKWTFIGVCITGIKTMSFGYTIVHTYIPLCTQYSTKHYTSHKSQYCYAGCIVYCLHMFVWALQQLDYSKQVTSQNIPLFALHVTVTCKMWSHFCLYVSSHMHRSEALLICKPHNSFWTGDRDKSPLSPQKYSGSGKVLSQWRHWWLYWASLQPVFYQVSRV